MKTLVLTSETGFAHDPPPDNPERVDRLRAVMAAIEPIDGIDRAEARPVEREALLRVHTPAHIEHMERSSPAAGHAQLAWDTHMSPGSLEAARAAAGAAVQAVDAVIDGTAEAAFCACRPPGHHAEPDQAMGFCLFNSVAVAAKHAVDARGLKRVAIVDFDVHHGNGTQTVAASDPRLFFASIHQGWIYPGTGAAHETGAHDNIVNVPVPGGTAGPAWREAIETAILPRVAAFAPDILLVSAGFDAHAADPLAGLALTEEDFAWVGRRLAETARARAGSRLVCVLEGGYDCPALEASVRGFVRALQAA
ncbi:acetoin utilization protein [Marinicauda salina]|uniref:Acetoin utilization protein n=1 Tax=Marinicauda salina TaxID=2135793 RepID=A0A2U2BSG4_9PROT|nr:histone deacetylase family protein [Marinicauda salina]PWE16954.1 acetoin utilization protein [Marinicauda salina]